MQVLNEEGSKPHKRCWGASWGASHEVDKRWARHKAARAGRKKGNRPRQRAQRKGPGRTQGAAGSWSCGLGVSSGVRHRGVGSADPWERGKETLEKIRGKAMLLPAATAARAHARRFHQTRDRSFQVLWRGLALHSPRLGSTVRKHAL